MKTLLPALVALTALAATGCASIPVADEAHSNAAKQFSTPTDGTSLVYVYTDRATDLVSTSNIYIDGKCIGYLNYSAFTYVETTPGEHVFGMESYQGANELTVTTEANHITILKAHSAAGFSYYLTLVGDDDMEYAKERIKSTPLVDADVCK